MGKLPAKPDSTAPTLNEAFDPSSMDEWDSDDVSAALSMAASSFRAERLRIGWLLWKFRALNVDAVYSVKQAEVAQDCDVDVRTLQRWRVFAETKFQLPPPDRRTEAARELAAQRSLPAAGDDKVSHANSREQKPEKAKVDEVIEAAPDPAPEPSPPVTKKPAQTAQLSLWEERETRPFLPSRPPASSEEADAAKALARRMFAWGSQLDPKPATAGRENPYVSKPNQGKRRPARATPKAKAEKCMHPVTRRIGDGCGACGQKVGGK